MKKMSGFTLIETMIVVAIVAIVAGLAYESYMESVRRSNRADAKTDLLDIAQRLQRCYTAYGRFNPDAGKCSIYDQLQDPIPTRRGGLYEIELSNDTATTYTLTATAILPPQTGDTENGCNVLTLDQTGAQTPEICW